MEGKERETKMKGEREGEARRLMPPLQSLSGCEGK